MTNRDYLNKGINAMARAHRVSPMSGHLGAAVVAGHFISEQHPDLDENVAEAIEAELERIIGGGSVFSPSENAAISAPEMFAPFPRERPDENLVDGIAVALSRNIDHMRESGHNVIFAAIAIRALIDHPGLATPAVVDGIRRLTAGFDAASPGSGYYGKQVGRVDGREIALPQDEAFPPYADLRTMSGAVLDELIHNAPLRRQGFGGLWHVINHGAALAELARYGYGELALRGLSAHRQHVSLLRTLPNLDDELGAETPAEHDPLTPAFWENGRIRRGRAHLTHRIKTLYGFYALEELVEDEAKRQQGIEKLRYLM
jgi:hypothetical protein